MKTKYLFIPFLGIVLFACAPSKSMILRRPLANIASDATSSSVSFASGLPKSSQGKNFVVSPASWKINDELIKSYQGQSSSFSNLERKLNVENTESKIQSSPYIFSTEENINESKQDWLKENYVSTFWGSKEEIQASYRSFLKETLGDDLNVSLDYPGLYYGNVLYVEDSFPIEKGTEQGTFKNRDSSTKELPFVIGKQYLEVYEDDQKIIVDLPISATKLRLGIKKDFSFFPYEELEVDAAKFTYRNVNYFIPEFSVSGSFLGSDPQGDQNRFQGQINTFKFDRKGIVGKSFTFNGPTSSAPDYEMTFRLDQPFCFASLYRDEVLYSGNVEHL